MYLFYINPNRKWEAFNPVSILTYVVPYVKGVEIYLSSLKMCFTAARSCEKCKITVNHGLRRPILFYEYPIYKTRWCQMPVAHSMQIVME